jgi:hypothetical protein
MAEACYTARATTKQQVLNGVNKLTLQTNKHGQYTHDAILLFKKALGVYSSASLTQATRARAWRSYSMTAIICSHW